MKKYFTVLSLLSCLCVLFTACGSKKDTKTVAKTEANGLSPIWLNIVEFPPHEDAYSGHIFNTDVPLDTTLILTDDVVNSQKVVSAGMTEICATSGEDVCANVCNPTEEDVTVADCIKNNWVYYTAGQVTGMTSGDGNDTVLGLPDDIIPDDNTDIDVSMNPVLDAFVEEHGAPSYIRFNGIYLYSEDKTPEEESKEVLKRLLRTHTGDEASSLADTVYTLGYEYDGFILEIKVMDSAPGGLKSDYRTEIMSINYFTDKNALDTYLKTTEDGDAEGDGYYTYTVDDIMQIRKELQK